MPNPRAKIKFGLDLKAKIKFGLNLKVKNIVVFLKLIPIVSCQIQGPRLNMALIQWLGSDSSGYLNIQRSNFIQNLIKRPKWIIMLKWASNGYFGLNFFYKYFIFQPFHPQFNWKYLGFIVLKFYLWLFSKFYKFSVQVVH